MPAGIEAGRAGRAQSAGCTGGSPGCPSGEVEDMGLCKYVILIEVLIFVCAAYIMHYNLLRMFLKKKLYIKTMIL